MECCYPFVFMKNRLLILGVLLGLVMVLAGSFVLMRNSYINEEYQYVPTSAEASKQDSGSQVNKEGASSASSDNASVAPGYPTRVVVNDAGIDIAVDKGYYNASTKKWTISRDKAYYAVMTDRPNTKGGNTFIYGHNRSNVFSRLLKIKSGSIANVITDNNQKYIYRLERSYTTNPSDSSILFYEGEPILTLQTCSGANFQNRTLFIFKLVEVSNV